MAEIVEVKVDELVLNVRNPRRMRAERWKQVLKTLSAERELLEMRPVLVRGSDKVVIAGNTRVAGRVDGGLKVLWRPPS